MAHGPSGDKEDAHSRRSGKIEIVLVTAPRCHFCDDASRLLDELTDTYPLDIRKIDLASTEGVAIASRYRVPFPPVLLIDGTYFSHGRISRRKLVKALDAVPVFFDTEPHPQRGSS